MIDPMILEGLRQYVDNHVPTGSFLQAVLENNLTEAFGRADEENRRNLFEIVQFCYHKLPLECWGSKEKVEAWLQKKWFCTLECGDKSKPKTGCVFFFADLTTIENAKLSTCKRNAEEIYGSLTQDEEE